ncbi:hypothetical protein [Sphingopyxis sp. JAI128]|uniref:hypothetical protein n=1 Tax=Sphingopyxis sp. JAI128 TaxID=2723066 RepID=UPI001614F7A6|nr:hypothetical protein [Sphingopyxis sp. JAI128]MBB6425291.1 hypothetical protein [Sphingopyxis sp. JAI128]
MSFGWRNRAARLLSIDANMLDLETDREDRIVDLAAHRAADGKVEQQILRLALWARLAEGADGPDELGAAIQQNSAPHRAIIAGRVAITGEWKLVHIKGIAAGAYPAGKTNVALTLGDAARTIDLGPAFAMKAD